MGQRSGGGLFGAAAVAALLVAGRLGVARVGVASFHLQYPGFVEQNRELRSQLMERPRSPQRDGALATVEANLRWAARFQRLGFAPEVFEELTFERELAERARAASPYPRTP